MPIRGFTLEYSACLLTMSSNWLVIDKLSMCRYIAMT